MKKNKKVFLLVFLIILFLGCLTGCKTTTDEDEQFKISEELNYLDTKIVNILNSLNNISLQNYTITSEEITLSQESKTEGGGEDKKSSSKGSESENQQKESSSQGESSGESKKGNITTTQMEPKTVLEIDENNIDWKTIKNEIEIINKSWAIIILDLANLNINNNDILEFSGTLDSCILSIKDENKALTLTNLAKLYSIIPKLESQIPNESNIQNIKQVKSYIINAYSLTEQDDWTGIQDNILNADETFKNVINDVEFIKNKEYKVNRTYVLLKELQNSLVHKDKKLFYVKYKNLLENINML